MALSGVVMRFALLSVVLAFFMGALLPAVQAQAPAPAPPPTNDGYAIDQGVAYFLLLLALVLTYLIHPLDAFPGFF